MSTIKIGSGAVDDKKADEKRTKEIRDFQRSTPANKRCFDCNEMMPQYIVLDFNTFVCTSCSGIHREFAHRIKGISMSKFTDTEVKNLLKFGGNDAAQKYWRAKHDPNFRPNGGTEGERTRNFIRLTYIDRKWVYESPREGKREDNHSQKARASSNSTASTANDFFSSSSSSKSNHTPSFDTFGVASNGFGDFSGFDNKSTPTRNDFDAFGGFGENTSTKTGSNSNKNNSSNSGFGDFGFTSTPSAAPPLSAAFKTGSFTLAPPPGSSFTAAVPTSTPTVSKDLFAFSPPKASPPANDPFGFDAPPVQKSVSRTSSNSSHQSSTSFDAFGSASHFPSTGSRASFDAFGASPAPQQASTRASSSSFDAFDAVAHTTPTTATPSSPFNAFGAIPTTPSASRPSSSSFDAFDEVANSTPTFVTPSSPFNAFGATPTTPPANRPSSSSFDAFGAASHSQSTPTSAAATFSFNAFGGSTPNTASFGSGSGFGTTSTPSSGFNATSTPTSGFGAFGSSTTPASSGFDTFGSTASGGRVSSGSFSSSSASTPSAVKGADPFTSFGGQSRTFSGIKTVEPPKASPVHDDPFSALDAVHAAESSTPTTHVTDFDAFNNMTTTSPHPSQSSDPFSFAGGNAPSANRSTSFSNATAASQSTSGHAADPFAFASGSGASSNRSSFNTTPASGLSGMGGSSSSMQSQQHQQQPTNSGVGGVYGQQGQQGFGGFSSPQQPQQGFSQQPQPPQQQQGHFGGQQQLQRFSQQPHPPQQQQGQFGGQFSQQSSFGIPPQQQQPQQWMQANHGGFSGGPYCGPQGQTQPQGAHHSTPTPPPAASTPAALNDPFASLNLGTFGMSSGPTKAPPSTSSRGNSFSNPPALVPVPPASPFNNVPNNPSFRSFPSPSTTNDSRSRGNSFDNNRVNSGGNMAMSQSSMGSFGFPSPSTGAPVKQSSFENVNAIGGFGAPTTPAPRTDSQSSLNPFDMF